jgi:hypothetical protein
MARLGMYVFTKKIHNTSLISAYFGLDSPECKCLEFIYYSVDIFNTETRYYIAHPTCAKAGRVACTV